MSDWHFRGKYKHTKNGSNSLTIFFNENTAEVLSNFRAFHSRFQYDVTFLFFFLGPSLEGQFLCVQSGRRHQGVIGSLGLKSRIPFRLPIGLALSAFSSHALSETNAGQQIQPAASRHELEVWHSETSFSSKLSNSCFREPPLDALEFQETSYCLTIIGLSFLLNLSQFFWEWRAVFMKFFPRRL